MGIGKVDMFLMWVFVNDNVVFEIEENGGDIVVEKNKEKMLKVVKFMFINECDDEMDIKNRGSMVFDGCCFSCFLIMWWEILDFN